MVQKGAGHGAKTFGYCPIAQNSKYKFRKHHTLQERSDAAWKKTRCFSLSVYLSISRRHVGTESHNNLGPPSSRSSLQLEHLCHNATHFLGGTISKQAKRLA